MESPSLSSSEHSHSHSHSLVSIANPHSYPHSHSTTSSLSNSLLNNKTSKVNSKGNSKSKSKSTLSTQTKSSKSGVSTTTSASSKSLQSHSQQKQGRQQQPQSDEENTNFKKKLNDKSDICLQNDEIYRKFRVSVKQTEDYIDRINTLSDNRIQERCANILLETKLHHEMDQSKELLTQIQHDYLVEVDKSLEDRAQLRAQRQFHHTHIEALLPEWCKILSKVKEVIGGYGHLNKLEWRSKAKTLLINSLQLMEQEPFSTAIEEGINTIRYFIRSINAYTAQHILMSLNEVKERYLKGIDSNEEGTLGHHCRKLREIDEIFLKKPVPLLREEWSNEIISEMKLKNTLQNSSILRQTTTSPISFHDTQQRQQQHQSYHQQPSASHQLSPIQHKSSSISASNSYSSTASASALDTHSLFSEPGSALEEKITNEEFLEGIHVGYPSEYTSFAPTCSISASSTSASTTTPSIPITSLPLLIPPPELISNASTAHQYLRKLAGKGQFKEAWGVFNSLYGEYIVYPVKKIQNSTISNTSSSPSPSSTSKKLSKKEAHFLKMNLKTRPTLEIFKLLILALKNSSTYDPYDIYSLLNLMKRLEIVPDIVVFNMILRICEKEGAWRRAIEFLKYMEDHYDHLLPNTNTYSTLVDCCRHSVETPAEIFETLRHSGLPRKFCYQAATCNAGNRLSIEVISHMFHDAYDPFDTHLQHKNTSLTSLPSQHLSSSMITEQQLQFQSTSFHSTELESKQSKYEQIKSQRKWKGFEDNIRSTLHWQSPAKHATGPSTRNLTKQVAKLMKPVEKRLNETTQFLDSYPSSQEIFQTILSQTSPLPSISLHSLAPPPPHGSFSSSSPSLSPSSSVVGSSLKEGSLQIHSSRSKKTENSLKSPEKLLKEMSTGRSSRN